MFVICRSVREPAGFRALVYQREILELFAGGAAHEKSQGAGRLPPQPLARRHRRGEDLRATGFYAHGVQFFDQSFPAFGGCVGDEQVWNAV